MVSGVQQYYFYHPQFSISSCKTRHFTSYVILLKMHVAAKQVDRRLIKYVLGDDPTNYMPQNLPSAKYMINKNKNYSSFENFLKHWRNACKYIFLAFGLHTGIISCLHFHTSVSEELTRTFRKYQRQPPSKAKC